MKKSIYYILLLFTVSFFAQEEQSDLYKKFERCKISKLSINTRYSDFGVKYFGPKHVVFSSPKKGKFFTKIWRENDQHYLELYKGKLAANGSIVEVEEYSKDINSKYHEAELALTKDGKEVYFTSNNHIGKKGVRGEAGYNNLQLYKADVVKGGFENIRLLPFNNKNYSTGHPTLSDDDKTLYFVSDVLGGYGQTDLYKVSILGKDTYGKVENLGPKINTDQREMFPFVDNREGVLYFASDREGTKGGLDVYGVSLKDSLQTVIHLPKPINTKKDDFALVLSTTTDYGFLSSNRKGGKGDDDIYKLKFRKLAAAKPVVVVAKDTVKTAPVIVKEQVCSQLVVGVVREKATGIPIGDANVFLIDANGVKIDSVTTSSHGNYRFYNTLNCNTNYIVRAEKEDHESSWADLVTTNENEKTNEVNLDLISNEFEITENGKFLIKIEPIYFDYNKANIRRDAAKILDNVVLTMLKYPNIVVEGGSHTDSRGSKKYNEKLSARRAASTVRYIMSRGINPRRISSKGYGESELVNKCADGIKCSEEEHQLNRRTEFVIVKR